jgi:anti-sigma factor RsiW
MANLSDNERANLVAYLDGELNEAAARAVESQLSLDPAVRAEAEALRKTWDLLEYLPRPEPSADFTQRTLDRVSVLQSTRAAAPGRWRPWASAGGWAAVVLAAASLGYVGGSWLAHHGPATSNGKVEIDPQLVRDLRLIENFPLYEHVDDMDFLKGLATPNDPDLFGDDKPNWQGRNGT